jgi:hypothetical protein
MPDHVIRQTINPRTSAGMMVLMEKWVVTAYPIKIKRSTPTPLITVITLIQAVLAPTLK